MKKSLAALLTVGLFFLSLPQCVPLCAETPSLNLKNVAIPESLGKIEERFQGTNNRWVVYIQDVHAHFGAQENIAAILDHLNRLYGIRKVAYEGGWNQTSYPKTWAIPPSREKQMVLRRLLEDDVITGPAFASMNADTPITLKGIEDPDLYKKNRALYLEFFKRKEDTQKEVRASEETMDKEKMKIFNPQLLAFDRDLIKFRNDVKSTDKFIPTLLKQAEASKMDLTTLDQIELLNRAVALEKNMDKQKLQTEISRLVQEFKNSRLSFEELVRSGKIPPDKLSYYPNANKQAQLMKLQDGIVHTRLFEQIETAISKIKEGLVKTEAERELDTRFTRFLTAKKILLFQASPQDLRAFKKYRKALEAELNPKLVRALALGRHFYSLAKKRDKVFFDKLLSDSLLAKEDIAIVTGGFHTDGLSQRLREKEMSYVVITPQLGDQSPDETLYFKRLQGRVHETQTLSENNNSTGDPQDAQVAGLVIAFKKGEVRDISVFASEVEASGPEVQSQGQSFMSLPRDEQLKAVSAALDTLQNGTEKYTLVVQAAGITQLLAEHPYAAQLIARILANPNNELAVLYKSFTDVPDVISNAVGSRNLITVADTNVDRALRQRRLVVAVTKERVAVMAAGYQNKNEHIKVVLSESIAALLLFRPLLEQSWQFSWQDSDTQQRVAELLQEAMTKLGLIESAA